MDAGGGVCSLLLWAEAAVGVDVGLTFFSSNRQALVTLNGGTGQWHRIEASTNLLDWRALTNLCQTNPTSAWLDTGATNFPQRFYRSLQLTPLDVYVATPDTNYGYTLLKTIRGRRADDLRSGAAVAGLADHERRGPDLVEALADYRRADRGDQHAVAAVY